MNLEYPGYNPDEPALFDELLWTELDSPAPIEPLQHGLENNSEQASKLGAQSLNRPLYHTSETTYQNSWGHNPGLPPPRDAFLSLWEDDSWSNMFLDPCSSSQPPNPEGPIIPPPTPSPRNEELEIRHPKTTEPKGTRRLKLGPDKRRILDEAFHRDPYPAAPTRELLGGLVGMAEKQVRSWFNNARARRPCKCMCMCWIFLPYY
jgi:hypothetical protein